MGMIDEQYKNQKIKEYQIEIDNLKKQLELEREVNAHTLHLLKSIRRDYEKLKNDKTNNN